MRREKMERVSGGYIFPGDVIHVTLPYGFVWRWFIDYFFLHITWTIRFSWESDTYYSFLNINIEDRKCSALCAILNVCQKGRQNMMDAWRVIWYIEESLFSFDWDKFFLILLKTLISQLKYGSFIQIIRRTYIYLAFNLHFKNHKFSKNVFINCVKFVILTLQVSSDCDIIIK